MSVSKISCFHSVWPDMAICRYFGNFGRCLVTIFCQKSPVHKSFDEDILASIFLCILGFGKFIYVLCRQIWRFLPKCWQLFGLNTWSHCFLPLVGDVKSKQKKENFRWKSRKESSLELSPPPPLLWWENKKMLVREGFDWDGRVSATNCKKKTQTDKQKQWCSVIS